MSSTFGCVFSGAFGRCEKFSCENSLYCSYHKNIHLTYINDDGQIVREIYDREGVYMKSEKSKD